MMNWKELNSIEQLEAIDKMSFEKKQAIFKHSTRCSISSMVRNRVERDYDIDEADLDIHFLDLISFRNISNGIADKWGVRHESPQMIILKNGKAIHDSSHTNISVEQIKELV